MALPPCPGEEVYSTIRKQEYNGKIPRFRRIQGEIELYTSDTVMQSESGSSWAGVDQGLQMPGVAARSSCALRGLPKGCCAHRPVRKGGARDRP